MTNGMLALLTNYSGTSKYKYMFLDRMRSDCEYFLGYGNRNENNLWSGSVKEHIDDMKTLYFSFYEKDRPQWLTLEQIEDYEKRMTAAD